MFQASFLILLASSMAINTAVATPSLPPPSNFLGQSWTQMEKASRYKMDCTLTHGALTKAPGLSATESLDADLLAAALSRLTVKETDTLMIKDKKASAVLEKSPSFLPYLEYANGRMSYDDALNYTNTTPKFSVQFVVSPNGLYYRAESTDAWNVIKSKELSDRIMSNLSQNTIPEGFDKASMNFDSWSGAKSSVAVYKGRLSADGAAGVIGSTVGDAFVNSAAPTEARIYVDKKTKNWTKIIATATVDTGKVSFSLTKTCQITVGSAAKVLVPSKAKTRELNAGVQEFLEMVGRVQ